MPKIPLVYDQADILILDDNPVNVELLMQLLEDFGYQNVRTATEPRCLDELFINHVPDLLLLDIRMPHVSGYQVLEHLKDRWQNVAPPVIVLSAQIDRETRLRALNLGAREFLSKPFDRLEVLQRVHNTLELHFLLRERTNKAALLEDLVTQRTAELHRLTITDPVTERPNRRGLLELLQNKLQHKVPVAVYFIVLEGLDDIARVHGYGVIEALNKKIGERLSGRQSSYQVGVWGGNEWLLLEFGEVSINNITQRANELIDQLNVSFNLESLLLGFKVRIGISHSHFYHHSAEHLVRLAAMALPLDNNFWQCYEPVLEQKMLSLNHCRQALNLAIDNNELFLVYQPKIKLGSGEIIGAEALLRWVNPELGFISPVDFIPIAEATGEILRIGDWVIDASILQLEKWLERGQVSADFTVAINVAALQLMQPDFAERFIQRLQRSKLPYGAIEVEVTESGLMQNVDLALTQLKKLADEGLSIAIDDFGTGYSSLSYLKLMPVSVLKIDRTFVQDMDQDMQDRRMVETVISMAQNLGYQTIAEGVERPEHVTLLTEMGCTLVQGYWYSPPLKADDFIIYTQQHHLKAHH